MLIKVKIIFSLFFLAQLIFSQSNHFDYDTVKNQIIDSLSNNIEKPSNSINSKKNYSNNSHEFPFFSINLTSGVWIPTLKLGKYFSPSLQIGVGAGLQITKSMRIEYTVLGRFLNNKNKIELNINDTIYPVNCPSGGSIGGCLVKQVLNNKTLVLEVISGLFWEPLDSDLKKTKPKNQKDKYYNISTIGCSVGMNTWIRKFGKQNIGVSLWLHYVFYNHDDILVSKIGGQYITLSLIYRYPDRSSVFWNNY